VKKNLDFCYLATSVELIARGFYYRIDENIAKMFMPFTDATQQLLGLHSAKCKTAECLIDHHLTALFLSLFKSKSQRF
jgi:hypothetical protein